MSQERKLIPTFSQWLKDRNPSLAGSEIPSNNKTLSKSLTELLNDNSLERQETIRIKEEVNPLERQETVLIEEKYKPLESQETMMMEDEPLQSQETIRIGEERKETIKRSDASVIRPMRGSENYYKEQMERMKANAPEGYMQRFERMKTPTMEEYEEMTKRGTYKEGSDEDVMKYVEKGLSNMRKDVTKRR